MYIHISYNDIYSPNVSFLTHKVQCSEHFGRSSSTCAAAIRNQAA